MSKVTAARCHDGKRHEWKTIDQRRDPEDWDDWRLSRCSKCGSTCECRKKRTGNAKWVRCREDGRLQITVPDCHQHDDPIPKPEPTEEELLEYILLIDQDRMPEGDRYRAFAGFHPRSREEDALRE